MNDARTSEESGRLRSISGAALLVEYAVSRGLPVASLLSGSGISENQLQDPGTEITLAQEIALTRNVVGALDDEPGMGLMAGLACHAPNFGVLGFAAMSSPTLRRAAEIVLQYADLSFTFAHHILEDHGQEFWFIRDDSAVPADLHRFVLERDLAAIATVVQDVLGSRLPMVRAEIAVEPHPIYEMFGTLLGVDKIVFGTERSVLIGNSSALDQPMPQSNPVTARYYERQCSDLIQQRRNRTGLSGRVRELLIRHGGVADQAHIAADLDVSVRTLRRRLASEGTTFREVSNETVGLLAEEMLIAGLTVEHAAERLGYSSVSAFTSAFRSWRGQSPGQFARAHRGRATVRV
ncbi:AraC family transcriptional regulator [Nocardia jiangxiensis]|uniref:AraC family transcriptional regulator n=1 Tax=Nocardia jiangxiensis TaxID=282685 RepID=A0ABW6S5J3_9NOCA|nr:AraC family transcriptional regulator [Nocardia jiangxiensis]